MTWNYRVQERNRKEKFVQDEITYGIVEVYYDPDGNIRWTENYIVPWGNTTEELSECLVKMLLAFEKPILDEKGKEIVR